jgi:spermidine synthase
MTSYAASSYKVNPRRNLPSAVQLINWLSVAAAPLGAALAFILQPIMAKLLLPRLGGTAATWLGAALFFQVALLLGYGWGLWLARRPIGFQAIAIGALSVLAIVTFHTPQAFSGSPTIPGVGLSLTLSCLPSMVLLFSISPWLHAWRERLNLPEPYALYALSSIGSLAALLAFPFLLEPFVGLSDQLSIWRGFFILLVSILSGGTILLANAEARISSNAIPLARANEIPLPSWLLWVSFSAITCAVMLAATQLIAAEIGSVPLAWVGPLGVYLASFTMIFSGRWQSWMTGASAVGLAISLAAYMTFKGFGSATVSGPCLLALVSCCGFASLTGNALLYSTRPARGGEWFYLALGIGGAMGGLGSIWIVPLLFPHPVEFTIGAATLLAAALFWGSRWRHIGSAAACLTFALSPVLILGLKQINVERMGNGVLTHYRDPYGNLMIKTDAGSVVLSSANTTHGTQLVETTASRLRPTLYYTESSAVGRAILILQNERPSIRIAAVGLGAGTIAAYARPSDQIIFYDIDPKIQSVARTYFSYLADSRGDVRIEIADGRRALAESDEDFDLVIIDAFSGGGIPIHLATREALAIYQNRINSNDGIIVFHASMRYSRLYPILAATAKTLRLESIEVNTYIENPQDDRDWDPVTSTYILLGSSGRASQWERWLPPEEDEGRVTRELTRTDAMHGSFYQIWTDDRNATLDMLSPTLWLAR